MLLKKLQEATLLSGVTVSNMQIIDTAIPPGQPVKPDRSKNLLLAVVIGLFGGVFLAIFADYMDDSVKSQDDVDTHLGQHFLGLVPSAPDMAMFSDPQSTISEAYRTIRMGLKFAASQRPLKTILVTSAIPNEGKTTTAANLGLALSQMGERILLVDADLRRQSMHKYFNLDNTTGLGSVIVEQGDVFAAIKRVEGHPHLSVLSAGPTFPNPSEVLSSEGMKTVLASLRDKFDAVIIDSPPIMPVSDPLVLSGLVDGVVLVARGGSTSRAIAKKACQSLEKMQAHIIGVVMNNVKIPKGTYGYYYYSYYRPYGEGRKDRA
jgi:capsular exopolysaccharide synthesis family protein